MLRVVLAALLVFAAAGVLAESLFEETNKLAVPRPAGTVEVITDSSCPCTPARTNEDDSEDAVYCGVRVVSNSSTVATACHGPICIPEERECCGCNFVNSEWICFGCLKKDKCVHKPENRGTPSLEFYCANWAAGVLPSLVMTLVTVCVTLF